MSNRINHVKIKLVKEGSDLYENAFIKSPEDAARIFEQYFGDSDREVFSVAMLNTKNKVIAIDTVSVGSLNSSIVDVPNTFKAAILSNCKSIIVSHPHPSGNPTPSAEDLEVTERLAEAGKLLGIELLDHVIVGSNSRYISLKERGYL